MNIEYKINHKVIETDRLILRSFTRADLDDFYEYAKVEGVGENAGWPHHTNKMVSASILELFIQKDNTFAICLKENNKVIGSIGIELYNEEKYKKLQLYAGREIGFVLSKDYWNKGIMSEAVQAIIQYLFDEVKLDFIMAGYFDYNIASKRVQEKCGFQYYDETTIDTLVAKDIRLMVMMLVNKKGKMMD